MKKIAINGFGRIGRLIARNILINEKLSKELEIVAVNDLTNAKTLAHLFKYDTAYHTFAEPVFEKNGSIIVGGHEIKVFAEKDPENLPWGKLGIDVVVESTGFFVTEEGASKHIKAGAKKVIISAPAKGGNVPTIVFSVNENILKKEQQIISAASCTTNALALVVHAINKEIGIEMGLMNTIHAFTGDQRLQDAPHSDLRRARAASYNIVPTSSGAAIAIGKVIPELDGKLNGFAMRVPVITGSVIDLSFVPSKNTTIEEVNAAVKKHASASLRYEIDPIVSSDIIGAKEGSIFDSLLTEKIVSKDGKEMFKIIAWYDNESSYVNQFIRTLEYFINLK